MMTEQLLNENEALRRQIIRLETDLDAMTAELAQAYDQLVPFLQDSQIDLDSAQDLSRFIGMIMSAVGADMGGVYLLPQKGRKAAWRTVPEDVVHLQSVRRVVSLLGVEGQPSVKAIIRNPAQGSSLWLFTPVIANGALVAAVGVGFHDIKRELKQSDAQLVLQMTIRVSGQLVNTMLQEMNERELKNQQSLAIAGDIQRSIQPVKPPKIQHLEVDAVWEPAAQVGGDAWGWSIQPNGSLGLFMVDISGKGVPAAIAAVALHTSLRTALQLGLAPAEVLRFGSLQWSDTLSDSELFATAVVMVIDPATGDISVANAGHTPTLLRLSEQWKTWRASVPPLGVPGSVEPQTMSARMKPGDLVVCFSDGISEIPVGRSVWGYDQIMASVPAETRTASDALRAIQQASSGVRGRKPRHDDETIFCVGFLQ
ncbi:MAG: serine/threonine-protein phosphatase [Pleurocapsa minor GSE-CHR-MK-17-07R]|jgi:serine phosphatase RsbU (regulator of sigma subunit)|nr:serine/threonine-protein phosphatase [Pleurocapsa minor GSE-CHR-MK 17-07R]